MFCHCLLCHRVLCHYLCVTACCAATRNVTLNQSLAPRDVFYHVVSFRDVFDDLYRFSRAMTCKVVTSNALSCVDAVVRFRFGDFHAVGTVYEKCCSANVMMCT